MHYRNLWGVLLLASSSLGFAQESKLIQFTANASTSYKRADGSDFTPILEVRCQETKPGKFSLLGILATGGLRTAARNERESMDSSGPTMPGGGNAQVTGVNAVTRSDVQPAHDLKIKYDSGKATTLDWTLDRDNNHMVGPANGFMKAAAKAQTVTITFPALGRNRNDDVVSQFDLSSFKSAVDKHPECAVK